MKEVDYYREQGGESLDLEEKPDIKTLGVQPEQDENVNQTSDIPQLLVIKKEEVSPEWIQTLERQYPNLHIKEEQEETWSTQEEKPSNGLLITGVPVKSEDGDDDDLKPQLSELHQSQSFKKEVKVEVKKEEEDEPPISSSANHIKTETGGAPETTTNSDPRRDSEPNTDKQASAAFEAEVSVDGNNSDDDATDDDDEWQEPLSNCRPKTKDRDSNRKESDSNPAKTSFSCSECGKDFLSKQSLQSHVTSHSGRTPSSHLLNKKCSRVKQKADSKTSIGKAEKRYVCNDCGHRFRHRFNLKRHMRVHTGEKPFSCDICGRRFKQQCSLKRHTRRHKGEKSFNCDLCDKRFNVKDDLRQHMKCHTGEKPFGCQLCGKTYRAQCGLKRHMIVHSGERPFHCDICGKTFNEKKSLSKHGIIHTGEKPFGCDVCGKKFRHQCNVKTHMRIHTGEKPFGCNKCERKFNQSVLLKKHMKVHTEESSL
ncbi:zinc finger protein OZF-like [Haplochromis burtoni]|uniref:Zinc finger protein OZF-like n=1 Tax=Haplochromis burtoni TaxID=8153 RepID=A0A3Q2UVJ7_HAPBU|nr:zinc finger protein OZF-like [Haplochromis burtoni]